MIISVFNEFFIKEDHFSVWEKSQRPDIRSILSNRKIPLSREEKEKLPQFGIGKKEGTKENLQLYPTNFVITEIDVPSSSKGNLSESEKFERWSPIFISLFERIKADEGINYWAMYLTSSMCGIRFILKLNIPVYSKIEYETIAKNFLLSLSIFGVKEEYIDNNANHAWYLPTFIKYFDFRRRRLLIRSNKVKVNPTLELFNKALELTRKKETFIEGNRNNFIHQLVCNANRFGIDRLDTLNIIKETDFNYEPKQVENTITSIYKKNQTEFGRYKTTSSTKNATVPLNQQIKELKGMPPIPLIWSGLKQGSMGFVFGPAKSGKSTFCECLAMSLASGLNDFMDIKIKGGPYKVLIISMEEHWQMRAERNQKQRNFLFEKYDLKFGNNLISSTEGYPSHIITEKDLNFIEQEIKDNSPQIVIIDSLSHIIIDKIEESSNTNKMMKKLREMASNTGITLIIIHHSTKSRKPELNINNMAGSRILLQEADFIFGINKVGVIRYLKEVAFRYAECNELVQTFMINEHRWIEPVKMEYESTILNEEDGRQDNFNGDLIFNFIKDKGKEVKTQELIVHFQGQISRKTIHNQLKKLIGDRKIVKVGKGIYKFQM